MEIRHISRKGKRSCNEDFIVNRALEENCRLVLVADGMGGYSDGDIASKTVAKSILQSIKRNLLTNSDLNSVIVEACADANYELQKIRNGNNSKLGATVGGILFARNTAICFWLGDVRIIHIKNSRIKFQSTDHNLVNELKNNKVIINTENYKRIKHIVTKSIHGSSETPLPEIFSIQKISSEDSFLICSDGVHNLISPIELSLLLQRTESAESFIKRVNLVCKDGDDNYSLIFAKPLKTDY